MTRFRVLAAGGCCLLIGWVTAAAQDDPGRFAPSHLKTVSGGYADPDMFYEASDCGACHEAIYDQWNGSVHSRAHVDKLYRAFADLARKEGGEDLYRFCSSCHAPLGVVTGEIAKKDATEEEVHTWITNEGVTCDACHTVKEVRRVHQGVPANASLTLDDESDARYGPLENPEESDLHANAYSEIHGTSEFCSGCHTLVHPFNGLVIENSFREWKESPFAAAGFQCKDCHMRIVGEAAESVAARQPLDRPGAVTDDSSVRKNVYAHLFTGANVNRDAVGMGERHAQEARLRLQTAAAMALVLPEAAAPGQEAEFTVVVANGAAGHSIPSSITELRQVWVDLTVTDAKGMSILRRGAVDADGRVDPEAAMFNAVLGDKNGDVTYLPWRAEKILWERLIHPGAKEELAYTLTIPDHAEFPLRVEAMLQYRSAPQHVLDELFGKGTFAIETVTMTSADGLIKRAAAR